MADGPDISRIAALIGDPARANMLAALSGGMALTAGELAREAGVTAQTATSHLNRLADGGLILIEKQGRHRYARLADERVASLVESLTAFAGAQQTRTRPGPKDAALRRARVCYDHLAGELGVTLLDRMVAARFIARDEEALSLTLDGRERMSLLGLRIEQIEAARRPTCRACLDWSERRHHLAGGLGAAILKSAQERGWVIRDAGDRALRINREQEETLLAAFSR